MHKCRIDTQYSCLHALDSLHSHAYMQMLQHSRKGAGASTAGATAAGWPADLPGAMFVVSAPTDCMCSRRWHEHVGGVVAACGWLLFRRLSSMWRDNVLEPGAKCRKSKVEMRLALAQCWRCATSAVAKNMHRLLPGNAHTQGCNSQRIKRTPVHFVLQEGLYCAGDIQAVGTGLAAA